MTDERALRDRRAKSHRRNASAQQQLADGENDVFVASYSLNINTDVNPIANDHHTSTSPLSKQPHLIALDDKTNVETSNEVSNYNHMTTPSPTPSTTELKEHYDFYRNMLSPHRVLFHFFLRLRQCKVITIFVVIIILLAGLNSWPTRHVHYPHQRRGFGSIRHGTRTSPTNPKIILLAGPHKTGTTSIQNNIYEWTRKHRSTTKNHILPDWFWPVPSIVQTYESIDPKNYEWTPAKGFYALFESMRDHSTYQVEDRLLFQHYKFDEIREAYAKEIYQAWMAGYNIVLGSEAMDYCVKDIDGFRILMELLDMMPWKRNQSSIRRMNTWRKYLWPFPTDDDTLGADSHGSIKDITVVVTYRSPRVKHLISIWHQTKKKKESFRDWIMTTRNELGSLDSLALVELFLRAGLQVILIDSSGLTEYGFDISSVVACDILGASCTPKKVLLNLDSQPVLKNVKGDKFHINVPAEDLDAMDRIMMNYDCGFQHLMDNKNLKVLYARDLHYNFQNCMNAPSLSRGEMKERIIQVLNSSTSSKGALRESDESDGEYYYYYYDSSEGKKSNGVQKSQVALSSSDSKTIIQQDKEYYYQYYDSSKSSEVEEQIEKKGKNQDDTEEHQYYTPV